MEAVRPCVLLLIPVVPVVHGLVILAALMVCVACDAHCVPVFSLWCLLPACRGLHTALVERGDFASGTSSKSTKLVHGGVRYLEKAVMGVSWVSMSLVVCDLCSHCPAHASLDIHTYLWFLVIAQPFL